MKRLGPSWIVSLILLLAAGPAASEVAFVTIDHIAIGPDGEHRVWISVLDGTGRPLRGMQPGRFSVEEDLVPIPDVVVAPYGKRYSRLDLTVVADPSLVAGTSPSGLAAMLHRLRERLASGDRLRVMSAGGAFPSAELADGEDTAAIESNLRSLGPPFPSRILDATLREVRRGRALPRDIGSIILLLTGCTRDESDTKALDLLALLRNRDRAATVALVLLGDAVPERDRNRLRRIVDDWTGGGTKLVRTTEDLPQAATDLVERARGAYLLRFRSEAWDRQADHHSLRVTVRMGAGRPSAEREFATADVILPPWWVASQAWLGTAAVVVLVIATVALIVRPRCLCRLVLESGEGRGYSYEILALPIRIGSMEGNDLILDEPEVSRNHVLLDRRAGGYELVDLNSENGTFVNGDRITRHRLVRGDRIGIGTVALRFKGPR